MATVTASSGDGWSPYTAPGATSLGESLRRARERRGLTLEKVARETKIPQRHLEALEHDNLTAFPSTFYQRAEIRDVRASRWSRSKSCSGATRIRAETGHGRRNVTRGGE